MTIGLYDADIRNFHNLPFNLEIMKLAAYYSNKGEITILTPRFEPERFGLNFYRQDFPSQKKLPSSLFSQNVEYGGLFFSNGKYFPLDKAIEETVPNPNIYWKFHQENFPIVKNKDYFNALSRAQHFRISLDGKTIWENYQSQIQDPDRIKKYLFSHDVNLAEIQDARQELLRYLAQNPHLNLALKFPIKVKNLQQFEDWYQFPLAKLFSEIQYDIIMTNEEAVKINEILTEKTNNAAKISYSPTTGIMSEAIFLDQVIFPMVQQVCFFKSQQKEILLKNESPILSSKNYILLFQFLNCYLKWNKTIQRKNTTKEFILYICSPRAKGRIPFTKNKLIQLFAFLAEKSPKVLQFLQKGGI